MKGILKLKLLDFSFWQENVLKYFKQRNIMKCKSVHLSRKKDLYFRFSTLIIVAVLIKTNKTYLWA